jgi:pyruvate ferredoxin oxidoreductase gamma subunit
MKGLSMIEIRFHGRGGQGAVTSAEILAQAAIMDGKYAQAFPSFGAERRGAPVQAFTRISNEPIRIRIGVYHPDVIVVLDSTLIQSENVFFGLKEGGLAVINSKESPRELKERLGFKGRIITVDATKIALEELGVPITNIAILGALCRGRPDLAKMESLEYFIAERFPHLKEKEIRSFRRAYEEVSE